jgi:predicted phosphodiesterase
MLAFLGDVHGHFDHLDVLLDRPDLKAVIFLGDLTPTVPLEKALERLMSHVDVYWIFGNHDTDRPNYIKALWGSALCDRNLHGRVVQIDGVRVAGLGGVFRGAIWRPPEDPVFLTPEAFWAQRPRRAGPVTPKERAQLGFAQKGDPVIRIASSLADKHRSSVFFNAVAALEKENADVLVTHEAPSCHPHGFAEIDRLARAMGVHTVFHGHHHDCLDYRAGEAQRGFAVHGVGFCGITDGDGQVVLPGWYDEARRSRRAKPE